jgi:hypothetical protein
MTCGFCGHQFAEEEGISGCGACGIGHGCNNIKCPKCGYHNPVEPALIKKLRNIFGKDTRKGA